jgi:hypothetical protein
MLSVDASDAALLAVPLGDPREFQCGWDRFEPIPILRRLSYALRYPDLNLRCGHPCDKSHIPLRRCRNPPAAIRKINTEIQGLVCPSERHIPLEKIRLLLKRRELRTACMCTCGAALTAPCEQYQHDDDRVSSHREPLRKPRTLIQSLHGTRSANHRANRSSIAESR